MTSQEQAKQILERLNAHHSMSQYANQEHLEAARTKDANIIAQALDAARRETWAAAAQLAEDMRPIAAGNVFRGQREVLKTLVCVFTQQDTAQANPTTTRELT